MKLKRLLFIGVLPVAAVFALTSCDSENKLTYTDASGEEVTLNVATTSDEAEVSEALYGVNCASNSEEVYEKREGIKGFSRTIKAEVNASASGTSLLGKVNANVNGSVKATEKVDLKDELASLSLDGNGALSATLGKTAVADYDLDADMDAIIDETGLYVDGYLSTDSDNKIELKHVFAFDSLYDTSLIDGYSDLEVMDTEESNIAFDIDMFNEFILDSSFETKEEFLAYFVEPYNISISATSSDSITFKSELTLAELEDLNEEVANQLESYKIDTKNLAKKLVTTITINTEYFFVSNVSVDAKAALNEALSAGITITTKNFGSIEASGKVSKLNLSISQKVGSQNINGLDEDEKSEYADGNQLIQSYFSNLFNLF